MAMQAYNSQASRNLIRAEMKFLKRVENIQVLGKFGTHKEQPLNMTDTVVFRRTKPFNSTAAEVPNIDPAVLMTSEGVTPTSYGISFTDIPVNLKQYAVLHKFSSKTDLMYEDDVPAEMEKLVGDTLGECLEMVDYGAMRAGTNVVYANGTTRVGVASKVSIERLRLCARTLESNRAYHVTSMLKGGVEFGSTPVAPSYVVFIHTDMVADVRDLPKFKGVEEYGTFKPVHPREIGKCEDFRFITSPLFKPLLAAGAAIGATGMYAADNTTLDVYTSIVIGEDCMGHVSLKGHGRNSINPTIIRASEKNHANPSGMFGFCGADVWYAGVRLNENWMVRLETAVSAL